MNTNYKNTAETEQLIPISAVSCKLKGSEIVREKIHSKLNLKQRNNRFPTIIETQENLNKLSSPWKMCL